MASCASFNSFSPPPSPPIPSSSSSSSFSSLSPLRRRLSSNSSLSAAQLGTSSTKPPTLPDAFARILDSGVIACLRAQSGELALEAAHAAFRGGISVLEIVMSTPGVLEVVRELRQVYPASVIGVGTVLSTVDARNAVDAGARFLMSPATIKEVLFDIQSDEVLYIPGVMSPTEVLDAYNSGARIVKIYPASVLGGAQFISVLKKPFSHIPMVASQGITLDSVKMYIESGASAVVLSDAIFEKAAMTQRNFDEIYKLASFAALQGIQAIKQQRERQEVQCASGALATTVAAADGGWQQWQHAAATTNSESAREG